MPMKCRPSRLATAPVVPEPKNGSRITSPGLVEATITRCSSASGFWVEWAFWPSASLRRSWPEQIGSVQSERICNSSFSAFIAS